MFITINVIIWPVCLWKFCVVYMHTAIVWNYMACWWNKEWIWLLWEHWLCSYMTGFSHVWIMKSLLVMQHTHRPIKQSHILVVADMTWFLERTVHTYRKSHGFKMAVMMAGATASYKIVFCCTSHHNHTTSDWLSLHTCGPLFHKA